MNIAIVCCFLDEEALLPRLLASLAGQSRRPDHLLLVDDGSTDRSAELAEAFAAEHGWASAVRRPQRPAETDRLSTAAELVAFQWGVEQLPGEWEVVVKLDGDLELAPRHIEAVEGALVADPTLGVAGAYLSVVEPDGSLRREEHPVEHVRGPNKFYRRACFEQISPLPPILGWDTIDELRARHAGWRTSSIEVPGGDSLHLRPTGSHGGRLRALRRWGECAWGFGRAPRHVLPLSLRYFGERPYVIGCVNFVWGYAAAAARRRPRAEPEVRDQRRREDGARIRRALRRGRG